MSQKRAKRERGICSPKDWELYLSRVNRWYANKPPRWRFIRYYEWLNAKPQPPRKMRRYKECQP